MRVVEGGRVDHAHHAGNAARALTDTLAASAAIEAAYLAVDPSDASGNTVFSGAANGGVWKTTNFLTQDPLGPTRVPLTHLGPLSTFIGATGSLGRHVVQQAIAANHEVAVIVRTPAKLAAEVRDKVTVHQADLSRISAPDLASVLDGHDAVINTAGLVTEGQTFVDLVDRVVTSLELLPPAGRPVAAPRRGRPDT